jgi:lysophospholipase L1-like esterase
MMINTMATSNRLHCFSLAVLLTLFTAVGCAEDKTQPKSVIPAPRTIEYSWMSIASWNKQFAEDVEIARKGDVDLLFVGDSITAGWPDTLWQTYFAAYKPANFGIGGDQTGNLLWRLEHGELDKLNPKVVVLMVGVNNFGLNNEGPEDVFQGVNAVVNKLREAFPNAKILLNAIFPYQETAQSPMRKSIIDANKRIKTLEDGKHIFFHDYGHLMLDNNGSIQPHLMPDFLHPAEPGYQLWAEAMMPTLRQWLDKPTH